MAAVCLTTATLTLTRTTFVETVIRTTTVSVTQEVGAVETILSTVARSTMITCPTPTGNETLPACTPTVSMLAPTISAIVTSSPGRTITVTITVDRTDRVGQAVLDTQFATTCTTSIRPPPDTSYTTSTTTATPSMTTFSIAITTTTAIPYTTTTAITTSMPTTYTSDGTTFTTTIGTTMISSVETTSFATLTSTGATTSTALAVVASIGSSSSGPDPIPPGTIAGGVVGGLAGAVLLALLAYYLIFKKAPAARKANEKDYHYNKVQSSPNDATAQGFQSTHGEGPQFTQGQGHAIMYGNPQGQQLQYLQPQGFNGPSPQYVGMQGVDYSGPSFSALPPGAAGAMMGYSVNQSSTSGSPSSGQVTIPDQGSYTSTLPIISHESSRQQQVHQNVPYSVAYRGYAEPISDRHG